MKEYIDYMNIVFNKYLFVIETDEESENGFVYSPELFKGLIQMGTELIEKYEEKYGELKEENISDIETEELVKTENEFS